MCGKYVRTLQKCQLFLIDLWNKYENPPWIFRPLYKF